MLSSFEIFYAWYIITFKEIRANILMIICLITTKKEIGGKVLVYKVNYGDGLVGSNLSITITPS